MAHLVVLVVMMVVVVVNMVKMLPQEKASVWLQYFFANWYNIIVTITCEEGYINLCHLIDCSDIGVDGSKV